MAFQHLYCVGKKLLANLCTHLVGNGPVQRIHGNTSRKLKNALRITDTERVVLFVKSHAEKFGIPHPAPLHGHTHCPPVYLPAGQNYVAVHQVYVESCELIGVSSLGLTLFRLVWHQCLPHMKFMTLEQTAVTDERSYKELLAVLHLQQLQLLPAHISPAMLVLHRMRELSTSRRQQMPPWKRRFTTLVF